MADAAPPGRGRAQRRGHPPRRHRLLPLRLLRLRASSTPTIDRLAAGGLRYTNFHVTPLCSPTRAIPADRSQPPHRRHAFPVQLRQRLPPHAGPHHQPRGHRGRGAPRRRLSPPSPSASGTSDAMEDDVGRRALRPVAAVSGASTASTGSWRARPTSSIPSWSTTTTAWTAPAGPDQDYHLSEDLVDRADALHPRHARRPCPSARSSPTWPSGPCTRPTRRRPPSSRSTGAGSTTAGTRPATRWFARQQADGAAPCRHRRWLPATRVSSRGTT